MTETQKHLADFQRMQAEVKKHLKQLSKNDLIATIQQLLIEKHWLTEQLKGMSNETNNRSTTADVLLPDSESKPEADSKHE